MHFERRAPEITELHVAATPVYSYSSGSSISIHSPDKILVGAWDAGFCSCLNFLVPNCAMVWCCPWVSVAQITARLGLYPFAKTLLLVLALHIGSWIGFFLALARNYVNTEDTEELLVQYAAFTPDSLRGFVGAWSFLSVFCHALYAIAVWRLRTSVRDRFQISGSRVWDGIAAGCCVCCTVAQIATHIKSYTPGSCAFSPPADVLPAYPSCSGVVQGTNRNHVVFE